MTYILYPQLLEVEINFTETLFLTFSAILERKEVEVCAYQAVSTNVVVYKEVLVEYSTWGQQISDKLKGVTFISTHYPNPL